MSGNSTVVNDQTVSHSPVPENSPKESQFKPKQAALTERKTGKSFHIKLKKKKVRDNSPKKVYDKQVIEDFYLSRRFFLDKLKTPLITQKKDNARELRNLYLQSLEKEKVLIDNHKKTVEKFQTLQNEMLEDQRSQTVLALPRMSIHEAFQGRDRFTHISQKDEFKVKKRKEHFQNFLHRQTTIKEVSDDLLGHIDAQKKIFFQTTKTGDLYVSDRQPSPSKDEIESSTLKEKISFFQRKFKSPRSIILDTNRTTYDPFRSTDAFKSDKSKNIQLAKSQTNLSNLDKPKSPSIQDFNFTMKKPGNLILSRNLSTSHSEIPHSFNAPSPTINSAKKFPHIESEFYEDFEFPKSPNEVNISHLLNSKQIKKSADLLWEKIIKYSEPDTTSRISTTLTSPIRNPKKKDPFSSWNRGTTPYSTERSIEFKSPRALETKTTKNNFGLKTVTELGENLTAVGSRGKITKSKSPDPVETLKKTLQESKLSNANKYKLFPEKGIRAFVTGPVPEHLRPLDRPPLDIKDLGNENVQQELMKRKVEIYELQMLEKMGKRLPHELRGQLRKAYETIARMLNGKTKLSSKGMASEDFKLFWAVIHDELSMKTLLDHKKLLKFLYGKDKEEERKPINKGSEEIE